MGTQSLGRWEAWKLRKFRNSRQEVKKAAEAYDKTIQLWQEYMSGINPKSPAEKAELIEHFEEDIAVLEGQNINSYYNFIESLRSKFE